MKIIKNLEALNDLGKKFSVTIGNFDGVHLGHQTILKNILKESEKDNLELVVVTFEPHPIQILRPKNHFLINSFLDKRELLKEVGVKYLCEVDFTRDVSTLAPDQFLENYIFSCNNVSRLYLGHDFAFGANKSGNHDFVKDYCKNKDVIIKTLDEFTLESSKISSTEIRKCLAAGNVEESNEYLGRNFFLSGPVIKGQGRGKQIGFPTANMQLMPERVVPMKGVYVTKTTIGDQVWHSVTNVGNNPTFNNGNDIFVETHILDFENDIYGNDIIVEFLKLIRSEKKFESVNQLVEQIALDVNEAKKYFLK